jgi:two-component system sensor histidine kinase KdpD
VKLTPARIYPYLVSATLVVVATLFGEFVKRDLEPTNLVMLYLLAVVGSAIFWGRGPAAMTAVLSVVTFDFFLVPPYLTFEVSDVQYLFTFAGLLVVGLVIGTLASKTREQAILRETEKLQTALLNSISHDFRTPLVSIEGALSSLLQDGPSMDEATRREILETAHEDSGRLNRLVGNLLDMTRVEAGALRVLKKPCEVRDLIGASVRQLKEGIEKRDIRIRVPQDLPEVELDYALMMRVFVNLIDNAAKYSEPHTPIEITARRVEDTVRIEVSDNGFGVPEEDLKKIFNKFYRAENPGRVTGTGLGLSICKGIVESHGGEIRAQKNRRGGGTVFVVVLPLGSAR